MYLKCEDCQYEQYCEQNEDTPKQRLGASENEVELRIIDDSQSNYECPCSDLNMYICPVCGKANCDNINCINQ